VVTVDAERTQGCPSLRLRSGAELKDPLGLARLFIAQDGSYQSYDLAEVSRDNSLSERDVRVANRIIARMGPDAVGAILSRAEAASAALAKIPPGASLVDQNADIPWQQLEALCGAFENLPGVGLPRLTKVLHKKRPALVPILDSVVGRYLVAVGGPIAGALGERGTALTRVYKEELDFCFPVLDCVREALLADGVDLTECRLLDIYLWAYSGQYDPLWRRAAGTPISQPAHAPDAASVAREAKVTDDIEVFRDAEAEYLAWIARHPAGWIVNCTRSLSPSYLILHRADCWTIGPRGPGSYTTRDYVKVCSLDRSALDTWAAGSVGGKLSLCGFCEGRIASEAR
jgi:hypothetical protein